MKSYSETAYDSTQPRELGPVIDDAERNWAGRKLRDRKLDPLPVNCAEFLVLDSSSAHETNRNERKRRELLRDPLVVGWMSLSNPVHLAAIVKVTAAVLAIPGPFLFIIMAALWAPNYSSSEVHGLKLIVLFTAVLAGLYFLIGHLIKHDKIPNRNNTLFERCTGLVHLPPVDGQPRAIPFDEFAPYQTLSQSPHGLMSYHLMLGHKYSNAFVASPRAHMSPWKVYLEWEYYQQFMDVSKPLPDTPEYEVWRSLDPTTVEWDKRMGRPSDFWRDFPLESWIEQSGEAADVAKAFPWGASREEALAKGWRPSCCGKMTWWNRREPTSERERQNIWQKCQ